MKRLNSVLSEHPYACPYCRRLDYQPLGGGRRRCLNTDCRRSYRTAADLGQAERSRGSQSCHLRRDQEGEITVNAIGGHGCGLHLRALDAHNRCPVSGEVIAEGGGQ